MSVRDIEDALKENKVFFGIKQCLKHKKKLKSVFIAKDARDETVDKLEKAGVEFIVLKTKQDLAKQLNLDFESEVFSIK
jgi:ribosomal protein L7Ae-like RNA K-turn-binding protein